MVILSIHEYEDYVLQALRAGAGGYIVKQDAAEDLVAAVRAVHNGQAYLSPAVSNIVINGYLRHASIEGGDGPFASLTSREREILQLVAEGNSSREIAHRLKLSVNTVDSHRARLMRKLNIRDQATLIRYAIRYGLVAVE